MKFFLKIKAWQLFLLILVPVFLPYPKGVGLIGFLGLNWLVPVIVTIAWLYSIGMSVNSRLPNGLKASTLLYNVSFLMPLIYAVLFLLLFLQSVELFRWPVWFTFIHFAFTIGTVYGLWFTAKQYVTFTRNEKVQFADYIETLFLFWFFPIGVWVIQPKINKAFQREA